MLGPGVAIGDVRPAEDCSHCKRNSAIFDEANCEMVCSQCGAVLSEGRDLSQSLEAQLYSAKSRERGASATKHLLASRDLVLSTTISNSYRDAHGVAIEPKHRQLLYRLKRLDKFASADKSHRRSMITASILVSTIKQKLGLTEAVAQKAAHNYSKALSMQLVRGRSIRGMVVASMYLACKEFNTPKNISELSVAIDANPRAARHCYNILVRRFKVTPANVNLDVYLNRAANTLEIRGRAYRRSLDFLNLVKGHHCSQGKNPRAIAAASIYLAIRSLKEHSITMAKLAGALDVSVVSVRKRVADIMKHCLVGEMNKEDANRSQNDGPPSRVACAS